MLGSFTLRRLTLGAVSLALLAACRPEATTVGGTAEDALGGMRAATSVTPSKYLISIAGDSIIPGGFGKSANVAVLVTDSAGKPVSGVSVYFATLGYPAHGSLVRGMVNTLTNGRAANTWNFGRKAGEQRIRAWLAGGKDTLTIVATVPGPSSLTAVSDVDFDGAYLGSATVAVSVADSAGDPFPLAQVTFLPDSDAGKVSYTVLGSGTNGQARVLWTFNTTKVGTQRLRVMTDGVADTLEFIATVAGPPVAVVLRTMTDSSFKGITGNTRALRVAVYDSAGHPVRNTPVTFRALTASGTVVQSTATSSSTGVVTATWTYGNTPGTQTVQVTAKDIADTLRFVATVKAPPVATSIEWTTETISQLLPTTIAAGGVIPFSVKVLDADSQPVPKASVRFRYVMGTGYIGASILTADAKGVATTSWIPWRPIGVHVIGAEIVGKPSTAIMLQTSVIAGAPKVMSVVLGADAQSALAGAAVPDNPTVRVTDLYGNPVSGVPVAFSFTNGSQAAAADTTDNAGVATSGRWTLGSVPGMNRLTAAVHAALTRTFTATGLKP